MMSTSQSVPCSNCGAIGGHYCRSGTAKQPWEYLGNPITPAPNIERSPMPTYPIRECANCGRYEAYCICAVFSVFKNKEVLSNQQPFPYFEEREED